MKIFAPGKLILSGEHSVVYGKPALAMAVNRYAVAQVTQQFLPGISFDFADLSYRKRISLTTLHYLKNRIKNKYQRFIHGDFKIRDVLQKPFELAQFAFGLFCEALNIKLTQGIKIHLQSNIPIGCGMGSSAATVLSIVHAIAYHLQMEVPTDTLFRLSVEAERMQRGFSTGLDIRVSMQGGCLYVNEDKIFARPIPQIPLYIVNTGVPQAQTGECVIKAAPFFKTSSIGEDFAATTTALDQALLNQQLLEVIRAVKTNHVLLNKIGVVPAMVQRFISAVEDFGGAAKICGAGAVAGNHAGIVLVVTENATALAELCAQYGYSNLSMTGESRGVHAS